MRTGSMFTGYGGVEMGVNPVFGASTAWHCEIDKAASTLLAHRYPDIPNLGDVRLIDWSTVEPVDLLTAGFPCQPVSNAGKRKGTGDVRWLWPIVHRAIGGLRPRYVFLENVSALVRRGLDVVLGDLASLGFDAEWQCVRASEIGAPHQRERIFIWAWAAHAQGVGREGPRGLESAGGNGHDLDSNQAAVSDAVDERGNGGGQTR